MAPRKPRVAKPKVPTPVDAIVHADKRANIPTADAHEFVAPEVEEPQTLRWPRDPSLDPQLVWRGKDVGADELVTDAPPIYIQEKIDPRVLVENLRRTAKAGELEPELTLFETFDGLSELDLVEFYRHPANWSNRMILGDALNVMASLAERERLRAKVQMIYLDPPYGIKFGSNWQVSARKRDVKDGKLDDIAREVEQIKAFRDTWQDGINSYLSYLRDRLTAAKDLLTESGSIFVQIGDENVHLVRSLLDEVFGPENFVSLITFKTTSGAGSFAGGTNALAAVTNFIVWYAGSVDALKYRQQYLAKSIDGAGGGQYTTAELEDGSRVRIQDGLVPAGGRPLRYDQLTSQTTRVGKTTVFPVDVRGRSFTPATGGWKTNREGMTRLRDARRLAPVGNTLTYVRYLDDFAAFPINNIWEDTVTSGFGDPKVYVVQTNTKVIERCMLMTTDPGDLVLDPTCGSGTTAYVAEQWGRRWITIDTSRVALALARQRLMGARFPYYFLADSESGRAKEQKEYGTTLPPAQVNNDIRHGFVYERVQHITLKSIANNPDIREGMSREEIDAAIKRHADHELLYDKPYEDTKRVRVTGPFTVESLSPHRSLAFAPPSEPSTEREAALDPSAPTFEQTVLANLSVSGIQNGRKQERLTFDTVEPYAGTHIQAVGAQDSETGPARVAIAIGPQYGTVGPAFIKGAAREAIHAGDVDLLCVLGFSFDPQALGATEEYAATADEFASVAGERSLGKVPVLLVRMNADLVMGEELAKTGHGNLFTVFGEPDIAWKVEDGMVTVEIRGVDVYNPTTGEVRSSDADQIALWMIDTAYNEESFFVRHCYFTGGQDPYARLKRALKSDVDEDAWASLHRTESRPFPVPDTGKFAVKVINDYGDEVMQVFETRV